MKREKGVILWRHSDGNDNDWLWYNYITRYNWIHTPMGNKNRDMVTTYLFRVHMPNHCLYHTFKNLGPLQFLVNIDTFWHNPHEILQFLVINNQEISVILKYINSFLCNLDKWEAGILIGSGIVSRLWLCLRIYMWVFGMAQTHWILREWEDCWHNQSIFVHTSSIFVHHLFTFSPFPLVSS